MEDGISFAGTLALREKRSGTRLESTSPRTGVEIGHSYPASSVLNSVYAKESPRQLCVGEVREWFALQWSDKIQWLISGGFEKGKKAR